MSTEFYSKLSDIQKKLNAPKNQYNAFGKYKYRSCEDILESVKPLLDKMFLSISDEIVTVGDRHYIKATATITDGKTAHSCSAFAREEEAKKGMDACQLTGATSSYARKYCLSGLFAIDDSKDADSNEYKRQKEARCEVSLKAFTASAMLAKDTEALKKLFSVAWQELKDTSERKKAKEVYDTRKLELENADGKSEPM